MSLAELIGTLDEPSRSIARETREALLDRMDVKDSNEPTRLFNTKVRRHNAKLWNRLKLEIKNTFRLSDTYKAQMRQTRKLKFKLKKSTPPILERLYAAREKNAGEGARGISSLSERANAKTPEQWEFHISQIRNAATRAQVACLVWWDFFAVRDRQDGQRYWNHLDRFMDEYVDGVPERSIANGLMQIGYHPYDAAARSIGGDIRS